MDSLFLRSYDPVPAAGVLAASPNGYGNGRNLNIGNANCEQIISETPRIRRRITRSHDPLDHGPRPGEGRPRTMGAIMELSRAKIPHSHAQSGPP